MEATELRIGNYVTDHLGRIQKVAETRSDAYICYLSNGAKLKYKLNTTQPIPLTDDYFDRILGSERIINSFDTTDDCEHSLIFEIDHDGKYYYTGGEGVKMSRTIQYVHELQNLAWELERAEITFK